MIIQKLKETIGIFSRKQATSVNWPEVIENIELTNSLVVNKSSITLSKLRKYLEYLEIEEYETVYTTELSGGQKQRVALLGAMLKDTPILLADEPTANLDSLLARRVMELLQKLSDFEDKSLLIVDDDNPCRQRLARAMEKKGFTVTQVESVKMGIDPVK